MRISYRCEIERMLSICFYKHFDSYIEKNKKQEETRSRLFAAPLAGRVLLRNITSAAEGVYKCEVSTEAPYFDTDYEAANLSVIGKYLE